MIEVRHLTKRYGPHLAVSDLSFTIEKGRVYGFLGPNGAGKSTTMNIITGCLGATEGDVFIGGHNIFEEPQKAKSLIGYLPELPPLYLDMTPAEYLRFVLRAKRVPRKQWAEQLEYAMESTKIVDVQHRLIRHLSKGYRQRVGFAQALLGNPEVIILDEPTVGLDPAQIIEIRELVRALGKNHTVILSSHILSEVNAVCDSILIISKGKLVASDTPENLTHLFHGTPQLTLDIRGSESEIAKVLQGDALVNNVSYAPGAEPGITRVVINSEEDLREKLFFQFADARLPILEMSHSRASLEDVFLELTTANAEEEDVAEENNAEEEEA